VATSGGGGVERALGFRGLAFIGKRGHRGANSGEQGKDMCRPILGSKLGFWGSARVRGS
jgi:hypothetical protein